MTAALLMMSRASDACDLILLKDRPIREAVRVRGVVVGYDMADLQTVSQATPDAANLGTGDTSLLGIRVAVREVVSGRISATEAVVVPLSYGPDCRTYLTSALRKSIEQKYPIGVHVVVRGTAAGSPTSAIVAEAGRYDFIEPVPADVSRTPEGDLDFRRVGRSLSFYAAQFEFERVVLTLSSTRALTYARLGNLAFSSGWELFSDPRQRYGQLLSESELTPQQRNELLTRFDEAQARR
jgi:hypothetical protein